jgi:hypothetical protein
MDAVAPGIGAGSVVPAAAAAELPDVVAAGVARLSVLASDSFAPLLRFRSHHTTPTMRTMTMTQIIQSMAKTLQSLRQ